MQFIPFSEIIDLCDSIISEYSTPSHLDIKLYSHSPGGLISINYQKLKSLFTSIALSAIPLVQDQSMVIVYLALLSDSTVYIHFNQKSSFSANFSDKVYNIPNGLLQVKHNRWGGLSIRCVVEMPFVVKDLSSTSNGFDFDDPLRAISNQPDIEFITNAIALLNSNFSDPEYGTERFLHDIGYSKTHVNSRIKRLSGMTLSRFIKDFRLTKAQILIEDSQEAIKITHIAYDVGFNDPKYFAKCFQAKFGHRPTQHQLFVQSLTRDSREQT